MSHSLSRPFGDGCPSTFRLDQLLAGELRPQEQRRLREHAAACAPCGRRLDDMECWRARFLTTPPPLPGWALPARPPPPPRRRRAWTYAAVSAVAIGTCLVVGTTGTTVGPDSPPADRQPRSKGGGARLGLYVQHRGEVRRAEPGEVLHPGDALRFTVTSKVARFVAVLSLDGAGQASIYFPDHGQAARVEPGVDVALPRSTLLDDVVGRELLVGVFCDSPVDLEPLRAALAAGAGGMAAPSGCETARLVVDKRPLP